MSKYNHIHSIPIESIPKEELAQAIKEWAEGDEAMERLLWACYENDIKTAGCHAGGFPYLEFRFENATDKVISLINATIETKGSQVLMTPDGGNPISGEEWYLPDIAVGFETMYKDEAGQCFDHLTESLTKDNSDNKDKAMAYALMRLLEFLIGKESALTLRFKYNENGNYAFSLESNPVNEEVSIYFNQLFTKANFTEENIFPEGSKRRSWKIESDNFEDMLKQLHESVESIINNYSLEPPTREEDITDLRQLARFKRKEFGDDVDSYERFVEWYEKKEEEMFSSKQK